MVNMRKILYLSFLLIIFSCEKADTFCWKCITTETIIIDKLISKMSDEIEQCNLTEIEIHKFEDSVKYFKEIKGEIKIEIIRECYKIN